MILIDANNVFYSCYYASHMDSAMSNNIFIQTLLSLVNYDGEKMLKSRIIWDGRRCWRNNLYKAYKGNRKPFDTDEQFKEFINTRKKVIRNIKKKTNFKQVCIPTYEADDIIAYYVNSFSDSRAIIIVSNDKDLFQLLKKNVLIKKMGNNHKRVSLSRKWFEDTYSIPPEHWASVKAIAGDSSDNIPGIRGIGEKRALKIIRSNGHLNRWLHLSIKNMTFKNKSVEKFTKMVLDNKADVLKFYKMVNLNSIVQRSIKISDNIYKRK